VGSCIMIGEVALECDVVGPNRARQEFCSNPVSVVFVNELRFEDIDWRRHGQDSEVTARQVFFTVRRFTDRHSPEIGRPGLRRGEIPKQAPGGPEPASPPWRAGRAKPGLGGTLYACTITRWSGRNASRPMGASRNRANVDRTQRRRFRIGTPRG
jgi:hypothetical protein